MNSSVQAWNFVCAALAPDGPESSERLVQDLIVGAPDFWPDVVRLADSHLVTPAVWCGLVGKGLDNALPDEPRRYLRSVYSMNQERNRALLGQLDEAILALNDAGIVPFLLKGAAHIRTGVYPDPAARILADLDLMVAESDIQTAFGVLTRSGYEHDDDWTHNRHLPRLKRPGEAAVLEVHWCHFRDKADTILATPTLWKNSTETDENGLRFRVASPTDTVMASFLHSQVIDGLGERFIIGLRSLEDLLALDRAYGNKIDWERIRADVERFGEAGRYRDYIYAARQLAPGLVSARVDTGLRERFHHAASIARIRWKRLDYLCERYNGVSGYYLKRRYGPTDSALKVHYYRMLLFADWVLGRGTEG